MKWIKKHRETLLVMALGLVLMASLNIMMLNYNHDLWIRPKVGFWSAFWNRFEMSGFDPFTYIVISSWRPLYALARHPLLSFMMWPLSELNQWLKDITGVNCAIYIVATVWTIVSTISWTLMYRIMRKLLLHGIFVSLLLTLFFFSFSHVMLTIFVEDHMTLSLPLLLLAVYWAGKAIMQHRSMPLWQSLPLLFVSTGVTTTNVVKVFLADAFSWRWWKKPRAVVQHFITYFIPLGIIGALYIYQQQTTQAEETRSNEQLMQRKAERDSVFAEEWAKDREAREARRQKQLVHIGIATNTEYYIDRFPSLQENIFGEGFMLHSDYTLKDANRHRPVLVRYRHWWMYAIEATIVLLFVGGLWYGRRERLMQLTTAMFLFDMLLHVGLNFASADVYIMTAHWAFVIPIAVGYMLRKVRRPTPLLVLISLLTLFLWVHNLTLTASHILK